jgi:hypothetical protein
MGTAEMVKIRVTMGNGWDRGTKINFGPLSAEPYSRVIVDGTKRDVTGPDENCRNLENRVYSEIVTSAAFPS